MTKTFELENKIANFKAHYNVVKGKLDQITQNINDAIELKEGYLLEIDNLEDDISTKQNQLLGLRRALSETKIAQEEAEDKTSEAIEEAEEVESKHAETLLMMQTVHKELEQEAALLKKHIAELASIETMMQEGHKLNEERFISRLRNLKQEIEGKKSVLDDLEAKVSSLNDEADDLQSYMEAVKERQDIRSTAIENREKELKEISDDFNHRTKKLQIREADILVIKRRIEKEYKKLHPNINIKI